MSNFLVAFLVALGVGAWIYSKASRRTGGQAKPALVIAGVGAVFTLIVALSLLSFIPR